MSQSNAKTITIDLPLKKFHMNWIKNGKVIIFIGKRGTGKSILVLDYLYHHRDLPLGTVISTTDAFNNTYRPHIPALFIHEEYSEELLEQVLNRQRDICRNCQNDPKYKNVDSRAFLILDDCLADSKKWVNDKNMKWVFMNGRHVNLTLIITMQYCMGIPPNLRSNVDYVFICKEPKISNQKRLYEQYAGIFPNFEMFKTVLTQCTADYGCLVIDNTSNSDRIEDQVFLYRSSINRPDWETFRLCYPIFWKNNDLYYQEQSKKKQKNRINYAELGSKKTAFKINIQKIDT